MEGEEEDGAGLMGAVEEDGGQDMGSRGESSGGGGGSGEKRVSQGGGEGGWASPANKKAKMDETDRATDGGHIGDQQTVDETGGGMVVEWTLSPNAEGRALEEPRAAMVVEQEASPDAGQECAPDGAGQAAGSAGEQRAAVAVFDRSDSESVSSGEEEGEEMPVGGDGRFLPLELEPEMLGVLDAFRWTRVSPSSWLHRWCSIEV